MPGEASLSQRGEIKKKGQIKEKKVLAQLQIHLESAGEPLGRR